jgi:hypothetical protein
MLENGLVINPLKCVFAQPTVNFLGHVVTATGISPLPDHLQAARDFPPPADVKQLQRFLGVINFYRRFIPAAAAILHPLTDALAGKPRGLVWTNPMSVSFEAAKAALIAPVLLVHPDLAAKLSLAVGASASHVGGVLQQRSLGSWQPLAFFSAKLSPAPGRSPASGLRTHIGQAVSPPGFHF